MYTKTTTLLTLEGKNKVILEKPCTSQSMHKQESYLPRKAHLKPLTIRAHFEPI